MAEYTLVIGNKNYSSWSMRAWLALKAANLPFREILVSLAKPKSRESILAHSPSGKVPVLLTGTTKVWDSLAICEFVAELAPGAGLWPDASEARAQARSVAAEMHAGFARLRENMPMDLVRDRRHESRAGLVGDEIARIAAIWSAMRDRWGKSGPFLFGKFGIADAMFAPVVGRFRTYGVAMDKTCTEYMKAVLEWPSFKEWERDAAKETDIIPFDVFENKGSC